MGVNIRLNMNSNYEETLDKNFDKALELCSNGYSYDELIEFLENGNIPEKQFAAIEIQELKSPEDAQIFISNLVNCDGKIREAVAQKFSEFIKVEEYQNYFAKFPLIFAQSTIDINANISRMVIDGLALMKDYTEFAKTYANQLVKYTDEAFDGLSKIVFRDKKYTINKQLFKLYWCLEGLNSYYKYVDSEKLRSILEQSLRQNEYTIREKVAQLLNHSDLKSKYPNLIEKLAQDENYYVKRLVSYKI